MTQTTSSSIHSSLTQEPSVAWFEMISKSFYRNGQDIIINNFKARPINPQKHPLTPIVLMILFPKTRIGELFVIQNMPEESLEDKIEKECAYRNLILSEFELKEVISDKNSGLRALISSFYSKIDPNSEEMTATILRGDIINHATMNPEVFQEYASGEPNQIELKFPEWQKKMAEGESPIGIFELKILNDLLETPIRIFSFEHPSLDAHGNIEPEHTLDNKASCDKNPINLYFDPIRKNYLCMKAIL
jgi:hypothetical protein